MLDILDTDFQRSPFKKELKLRKIEAYNAKAKSIRIKIEEDIEKMIFSGFLCDRLFLNSLIILMTSAMTPTINIPGFFGIPKASNIKKEVRITKIPIKKDTLNVKLSCILS